VRPALLALALSLLAPPALASRVVLIGIDGGSWNLIDAGLARGELPSFATLAGRGLTAELATVEPVISPAVWTSIATGRSPAAHGVTHFYVTREDVRSATVFERLAAQGLRVGLYDWLVTWPPLALPGGFVVPGWLRSDQRVEPPEVFARAGVSPYSYTNEFSTPEAHAENCAREPREKAGRFVALLRAFDPQLAAVTFYALDEASHRFWRAAFPGEFEEPPREAERALSGVIASTLRALDGALGEIQEALGPEDHLIVVSDHGFQASDAARNVWVTDVPAWLRVAEVAPEREGFRVAGGFGRFVVRVPPGPFEEREPALERALAFVHSARTREGEPLFQIDVLDGAPRPVGHERGFGEWARQLAVRAFLWWNSVELTRPAHALFGTPRAELLEALWPDGRIEVGGREIPLAEVAHPDAFSGTHHPTGILLAAGPAFRTSRERLAVSVLEVAALVHYLAGTAIPDDLERPLREDLLDPAYLAVHPPARVGAASLPLLEEDGGGARPDPDRMRERLRGLGYVE
jgi:predicted AlkP superfamily phosphohydrolase/phosphomutase